MSEAPSPRDTRPTADADAWSKACAEDIAEQASKRRVRQAYQPGSAADELRKLADAVAGKVQELSSPIAGLPAQMLISQAKSVLGQARDRNPDLFDHLAAAGSELLAAYRSAVDTHERSWTSGGPSRTEHIDLDRVDLDRIDLGRTDAAADTARGVEDIDEADLAEDMDDVNGPDDGGARGSEDRGDRD